MATAGTRRLNTPIRRPLIYPFIPAAGDGGKASITLGRSTRGADIGMAASGEDSEFTENRTGCQRSRRAGGGAADSILRLGRRPGGLRSKLYACFACSRYRRGWLSFVPPDIRQRRRRGVNAPAQSQSPEDSFNGDTRFSRIGR